MGAAFSLVLISDNFRIENEEEAMELVERDEVIKGGARKVRNAKVDDQVGKVEHGMRRMNLTRGRK